MKYLAYLVAFIILSWVPVALVFAIMGIWGDDGRWLATAFAMATAALLFAIGVSVYVFGRAEESEQEEKK